MKLLVAAITFAATLGVLFLIESGKPPKEDYAQIIEALKEENANAVVSVTPSRAPISTPIRTPTPTSTSTPTPQNSPAARQTSTTPTPTQIPTRTPSPTPISATSPSPSPTSSTTPVQTPTTILTPTPVPQETAQGFIDIASITSPVEQNSTAQLIISTVPDAQCSIKVTLPSGKQSTASGTETPIVISPGSIKWEWKISWNTTPGTATIEINCTKDGQNFSKSLQMDIIER